MSVVMGRFEDLWSYPIHKVFLGASVAFTYWFGYDFVESWTNKDEIDFTSLLITIISVSTLIGVIKDMIKRINDQ